VGAPGKPIEQGQRRDVRRSHAARGQGVGKEGKVAGKSFRRICVPGEGIKSGEIEKAWGTVPAWVGQARFLQTLTYESLTERVRHANV
jgi:hypothetical protein